MKIPKLDKDTNSLSTLSHRQWTWQRYLGQKTEEVPKEFMTSMTFIESPSEKLTPYNHCASLMKARESKLLFIHSVGFFLTSRIS